MDGKFGRTLVKPSREAIKYLSSSSITDSIILRTHNGEQCLKRKLQNYTNTPKPSMNEAKYLNSFSTKKQWANVIRVLSFCVFVVH